MAQQQPIGLLILGIFLGQFGNVISESSETCVFNVNGTAPQNGLCEGPVDRAVAVMEFMDASAVANNGCGRSLVAFVKDSAEGVQYQCGECLPGGSGIEAAFQFCAVNEFCSDDGYCLDVKNHPLFGQECPFENDSGAGLNINWCGPGLRCIQHKCLQCIDGWKDTNYGNALCVEGQWTFSHIQQALADPYFYVLAGVVGLLVLNLLFGLYATIYRKPSDSNKTGDRHADKPSGENDSDAEGHHVSNFEFYVTKLMQLCRKKNDVEQRLPPPPAPPPVPAAAIAAGKGFIPSQPHLSIDEVVFDDSKQVDKQFDRGYFTQKHQVKKKYGEQEGGRRRNRQGHPPAVDEEEEGDFDLYEYDENVQYTYE